MILQSVGGVGHFARELIAELDGVVQEICIGAERLWNFWLEGGVHGLSLVLGAANGSRPGAPPGATGRPAVPRRSARFLAAGFVARRRAAFVIGRPGGESDGWFAAAALRSSIFVTASITVFVIVMVTITIPIPIAVLMVSVLVLVLLVRHGCDLAAIWSEL